MQGDFDIYNATFADLKATAINNAVRGLRLSAAASSPEAMENQVLAMLNDFETAKVLSVLTKQNALGRLDYWNSNPEQYKIMSFLGDPVFHQCLENIVMQANVESTSKVRGVGPIRFMTGTNTAAFLFGLTSSDYSRYLTNGITVDAVRQNGTVPFWSNPDGSPAAVPWKP